MKRFLSYIPILFLFFMIGNTYVSGVPADIGFSTDTYPAGTIAESGMTVIGALSLIQSLLLNVMLPIVIVGGSLYVAYELFTAEGDETKMKKAWKSVTFSAIGLVCIAVSYAFVEVLSRISL